MSEPQSELKLNNRGEEILGEDDEKEAEVQEFEIHAHVSIFSSRAKKRVPGYIFGEGVNAENSQVWFVAYQLQVPGDEETYTLHCKLVGKEFEKDVMELDEEMLFEELQNDCIVIT